MRRRRRGSWNPPSPGCADGAPAAEPKGLEAKELFLGLVHSFQSAAMQQMGKIMNPFTQAIERDMPQARLSIDMVHQNRRIGPVMPLGATRHYGWGMRVETWITPRWARRGGAR